MGSHKKRSKRKRREAPEVVERRLWKLTRPDPRKAYSTRRDSPRVIEVLEQGSRVVHRAKVRANDDAEYVIERGWLIERTYPAAKKRNEEARVAKQLASLARRKANTAATRDPVFQMFLRQLTAIAGTPTKTRVWGVSMWSFPPLATDDDFFLWQGRARHAGGALTNHTDYRGHTLRLVSGRVSRLGALFGAAYWYGGEVQAVLDALDDDAGLVIDFVEYDGLNFEIALDRIPRNLERHAQALGSVFGLKPGPISKALRKRLWRQ